MNSEEAKFILQAYRPGGQDAGDPQFAEALEQAQRDPELAEWFAQERALDSAIASRLRESPVPAGLKASTLAGRNVIQPARWWNQRAALALAASLVFLIALAAYWLRPPQGLSLAAFRQEMTQRLSAGAYALEIRTADLDEIQQWLGGHGGHGDFVLPAGLKGCAGHGCQVLNWQGKRVSMICIRADGLGIVHLFTIDRADLRDRSLPDAPVLAGVGEWMTASWSQGNKVYLLAGGVDRAAMAKLL